MNPRHRALHAALIVLNLRDRELSLMLAAFALTCTFKANQKRCLRDAEGRPRCKRKSG